MGLAGGDGDGGGVVDLVCCSCWDEGSKEEEEEVEEIGEHVGREYRVRKGAGESNLSDSRSFE